MNIRKKQRESTRQAILEALAEVIAESGATSFSVQEVADRAGVTHRTVYNHFPTREALNDGLAVYVEEEMGRVTGAAGPPDTNLTIDRIAEMPAAAFSMFDALDAHVRAYVMLMVASRAPATVHRERTAHVQRVIERDAGPLPAGTAPLATAALRMFMSAWTWHLMTEHLGLTTKDAERTTTWALDLLVRAIQRGDLPPTSDT